MIPWLRAGDPFPPVENALAAPNGLLAAGAELTRERLLDAYRHGIFPWYSDGEPVLWWSPDPRMVLIVDEFRAARSLRRTIRAALAAGRLEVSADRDFRAVIEACRAPRRGQDGTWITDEIVEAYCELHRIDCAHSIEVRLDGELAGGLYGVALGRMFFGESMFSTVRDASKIALAALVALLKREQVRVIDCQQNTPHLASLGAREIERSEFRAHLASAVRQPPVDWSVYRSGDLNHLLSSY